MKVVPAKIISQCFICPHLHLALESCQSDYHRCLNMNMKITMDEIRNIPTWCPLDDVQEDNNG